MAEHHPHTGRPAADLQAPDRQARHGIERLRWLAAVPTDPTEIGFAAHVELSKKAPRMVYLSEGEIQVEVAYALIEELHDAILKLSSPSYVIKGTDSS